MIAQGVNEHMIKCTLLLLLDQVSQLGSEFRSCVKVEVAILDSLSLTVLAVSVDVKQH